MAARPPKPPGLTKNNQLDLINFEHNNSILELKQQQQIESIIEIDKIQKEQKFAEEEQHFKCLKLKKNNCICTNISIMHLFHEMKQKFPTVPDHIVNQCVIDNCHDRENCIKLLNNELALHPTTAQSYPSTLLLRNNQNINGNINNNNKPLKPTRPAPVPKFNQINNCDTKTRNFINLKPIQQNPIIKSPLQRKSNLNNKILLINNDIKLKKNQKNNLQQKPPSVVINYDDDNNSSSNTTLVNLENNIIPNLQQQKNHQQPQRPTTLNFHEPIQKFNPNQQQQQVNRPVRKAPPPPVGAKIYTSTTPLICSPSPTSVGQLQTTNFHNNFDQSFSSTTSIQSPLSFSDSGESEISVNISLSPSSDRSRQQQQQQLQQQQPNRRISSSITLQPEPPYTRDFIQQQNQRSFTSLNLTLRKPTTIPQSPIDITAGPGLTYSSSSYDPRRGYQKNFHITVTDQGGMFSASRIRPKSCFVSSVQHPEEEFHDLAGQVNLLRPASSELNVIGNNSYIDEQELSTIGQQLSRPNVCLKIIERQKSQKEQLILAIEKNKKRLEHIQQEIKILKMPEYPGLSERLDMEIDKLRCNCEDLLNEIDTAKQLGQIENSNEISLSAHRQNKPPRPPLPRVHPANTQYQQRQLQQQQQQLQISSPLNEQLHQQELLNDSTDEDGPQWSCKYCTFLNDPLMIRCEKCDNIREIPGTFNNKNNKNILTNSNITNNHNHTTTNSSSSSTLINNNGFDNQSNLTSAQILNCLPTQFTTAPNY